MKKEIIISTILCIILLTTPLILAEKLDIQIKDSYTPGDDINFKIVLYDEDNNKIDGEIYYEMQNYYTDIIDSKTINSGEQTTFKLPENAIIGYWAIIARKGEIEKKQLFDVKELEKADIKLEDSTLIITNIGNIPYAKSIGISIDDYYENIFVSLDIGEKKEIQLTGQNQEYNIKIYEGEKEKIEFQRVTLTGNVIGVNQSGENFVKKYPLVGLFLIVIVLAAVFVFGSKFFKSKLKK